RSRHCAAPAGAPPACGCRPEDPGLAAPTVPSAKHLRCQQSWWLQVPPGSAVSSSLSPLAGLLGTVTDEPPALSRVGDQPAPGRHDVDRDHREADGQTGEEAEPPRCL